MVPRKPGRVKSPRMAKSDRDGAMADSTEALTADPHTVLAFYYRGSH